MNLPMLQAAGSQTSIPAKIESAMRFLDYAQRVSWGPYSGEGWKEGGGRELSAKESKVYDAALSALLSYFNSPDNGQPAPHHSPPPPDGPKEKVPV